jgi:hypothetical protein
MKHFIQAICLSIASAREAVAGSIVVDSLARNIETKTTHAATDQDDQNIDNGEENLPRGREPLALVDVQPVDTTKTVTEPTSKQRADQRQEIAEHRNSVSNDPGDDPTGECDGNPGSDGSQVALVHAIGSTEEADIDVLETDMAVDNTSTNNLKLSVYERESSKRDNVQ